jgi:uncharacterized repeat protein (TIGR03837 family)
MKNYDIFCKIVDNFGDIGVCWRLAKQLEAEHGISIRLWIDDLNVARQLIPALDTSKRIQLIDHIKIAIWDENTRFEQAANAVIEAFGCELPPDYMALMETNNVWINLEYLSAEAWVEGFHAKHSQRGKLTRYFFFPGFTEATGGLLREHDIAENNQKIAADKQLQSDFFQRLHLTPENECDALKISLFSYEHAPISDLLAAMADSATQISCYVPATGILPKVAEFFSKASISAGDSLTCGSLALHVLPFLSQDDYDRLLASCDINFVRGEDSWIRAIWAGKPFIWQPYLQTEGTHLVKLKAFLDVFYANCEKAAQQATIAMHNAWSSAQISASIWQNYLDNISSVRTFTAQQTSTLAAQTDLATNLVIYIEKLHHNKI